MKRKLLIGLLLALIAPLHVFADFTYDLTNYKETDDQVTIYVFRGNSCGYCEAFLNYLGNDLVKEYGQYFKVVSFETYKDSSNAKLLKEVDSFLGITDPNDIGAVPLIIIGEEHFLGYGSSDNEAIKAAIKKLYESNNRYDIFEEMNKKEESGNKTSMAPIIVSNLIITTIGVVLVVAYTSNTKAEILDAISEANKKAKTK